MAFPILAVAAGRPSLLLNIGVALVLLGGCAAKLVLEPVTLESLTRPEAPRVLTAEAKGRPTTGDARP